MTDKEKDFAKKVNVDKANNKIIVPIVLGVLNILTYIIPMLLGMFDFGIIFEVISFIFLLISKEYIEKYDESRAKIYTIIAIASIGWIFIYDILTFCLNIQEMVLWGLEFYIGELFTICYLISLIAIYKDLAKAENPEKYKENTDFFYERLEDNEKDKM